MACHITLLPQDCHKRETMGWGWQVLGKPLPLPLREKNLPGRPEKEQKWGGGTISNKEYIILQIYHSEVKDSFPDKQKLKKFVTNKVTKQKML